MHDERRTASVPAPREAGRPYRVSLICLGNICRSPTAEIVVRSALARNGLADDVEVDSFGTGDWHVGAPIDRRAGVALTTRGYDGGARHRARQLTTEELARRDLVLALDAENLADLRELAPEADLDAGRVRLLRSFDPEVGDDAAVPDPYYGGDDGFSQALDLIESAAAGLVRELRHLSRV